MINAKEALKRLETIIVREAIKHFGELGDKYNVTVMQSIHDQPRVLVFYIDEIAPIEPGGKHRCWCSAVDINFTDEMAVYRFRAAMLRETHVGLYARVSVNVIDIPGEPPPE